MADLSQFNEKERAFIASVPYRVGIWISNSDDNTGTQADDKDERKALEMLIADLASKSQQIPFAAAVMRDVEQNKGAWASWDQMCDEEAVLADVEKALALCKAKTKGKELNHYKQTIWRVGLVVAQAYGEHIDPDNEMHFNNFFGRLFGGGPKIGKNPENMSKEEKIALNKLRKILKS